MKFIKKNLTEMKELQKFQSSTFDTLARQKLIEDQKTIMELSGRLQELQNEVNCMNDSKDFQDAESIRSGNSHVTSPPGLFPKHPPFQGMLRPSSYRSDKLRSRHIFGIHPYIRKRFCTSTSFFISSVSSGIEFYLEENYRRNQFTCLQQRKVEDQKRDPDLKCQSGPSAKNSVIFSGGDSSKNYGADQQRLQISDLQFRQVPYASNLCLLEDKIQDRGMYLFTISYGSNAMDQGSGVG